MSEGDEIDEKLLALSLRTLVEQLPFDVWVRGVEDDRMLFANTALRDRWGPALLGHTVDSSGVTSDVAEKWRRVNARAIAGETVKDEVTYDIEGKEQQTIIGVVTAVRDNGEVKATVGMNVDVTGERRAQAEAHRLGRLLGEVFTSAPVAMGIRAVRGDDLVHVEANPCAASLLGLTPDTLRGRTDHDLDVPHAHTAEMIARFREARTERRAVSVELPYRAPDGTLRMLEGKVIAIDEPGEERYAYIAAEVTELQSLQTGIIRADRLASLGTLSASIGHEIGTSAAVALGQVEISAKLVEREASRDEILVSLKEAEKALHRAVGVLRDMRALAVGATLGSETCEVGAALDTVKDVLRAELTRSAVLYEARSDGPHEVAMSHSRLVQILLNLVRNALDAHAPTRGSLWLEVSRLPDHVCIDVADDGPGLSRHVRENLFQPFVTTRAEGTGLGLYVCKLLATLSGGTIDALPRPRGGLQVRLLVPAASTSA